MRSVRAVFSGLALIAAGVCAAQPEAARDAFTKGLIEGKYGLYQKAVGFFDEAIRLSPRLFSAWLGRGAARQVLGDRAGAADDLARAVELAAPGSPERAEAERRLRKLSQ
jgi:tetratricopeptide (TPR) repeat protein